MGTYRQGSKCHARVRAIREGLTMHTILTWLTENFVPVWKAASILFTGAFGILGLVKNFKEKKKDPNSDTTIEQITIWGWISLIGIIVSTGCGMAVQLKESRDDAKKSLELSRKSDDTLREIKKILSPLDITNVHLVFRAACVGIYEAICASEQAFPKTMAYEGLDYWVYIYPNNVELGDLADRRYSYDTRSFESSIHFAITSQHNPAESAIGPLVMIKPFGKIKDATVGAGGAPMAYTTDGKLAALGNEFKSWLIDDRLYAGASGVVAFIVWML